MPVGVLTESPDFSQTGKISPGVKKRFCCPVHVHYFGNVGQGYNTVEVFVHEVKRFLDTYFYQTLC